MYPRDLRARVRGLRRLNHTYGEINIILKTRIPKSTLYEWCNDLVLPLNHLQKIQKLNLTNLQKAREIAAKNRELNHYRLLKELETNNLPISKGIIDTNTSKIALAMLCLGEASKSSNSHAFSLGSSDPRIVTLFIKLLTRCFPIDYEKLKCGIQCRADQNPNDLKSFWSKYTGIPTSQFYKPLIDKRTIGKPTRKLNYKGVLNVYYPNKKVQLELETLSQLIYNTVSGPVVYR